MNSGSRTGNAMKNIILNILNLVVSLVISFFSRRIFNDVLGAEYLGISGLFSNILSILSLSELGISSAIMYNLYKPVADNDTVRVTKIINFYKQMYHIIGCTVFAIGMAIMPLIKYIVNLNEVDLPNRTLYFYYFLMLFNSAASYFFVYKTAILTADQKNYKLSIFNIIIKIILILTQIAVLLIFKSYVGYILVQIIFSLLTNVVTSSYSQRKYPFIKGKESLEKTEKKRILFNVKDIFSYQLGSVILNNTDNILISVLDSTKMVGLYSNYCTLISTVSSFAGMIFTSLQSSIGNFVVGATEKKQHEMFKLLTFISFFLYTVGSVGIYVTIGDIIQIWFDDASYVLSKPLLIAAVANFYICGALYPVWCYRNTVGLFNKTRNVMFVTSALNLILSVVLGKLFGVSGILFATGISRILTTLWFEPLVLFKDFFRTGKKEIFIYFAEQIWNAVQCIIFVYITNWIASYILTGSILLNLVIKLILCIMLPMIFIFLFNFKTSECKLFVAFIKKTLKKMLNRLNTLAVDR